MFIKKKVANFEAIYVILNIGCTSLATINVFASSADNYKQRLPEELHDKIVELAHEKETKVKNSSLYLSNGNFSNIYKNKMSMTTNAKNIAWDIINCGLQNAPNSNSECNAFYNSQQCASIADFQIPEPWNGDIENAPILFVGLNPGFLDVELYPKLGNPYWLQANGGFDEAKVEDFFEHRFNSRHQYVKYPNETKIVPKDYKRLKGRTFWGYVKSIADKILNRESNPGVDFAITEIVHCKSRNISCIHSKCYNTCFKNHFVKILSIAQNLQFMVVLGSATKKRISTHFGISSASKNQWYKVNLKNKTINIIFVDHNAAWGASAKNIPLLTAQP